MTYLEKLKDPRWLRFRDAFIARQRFSDDRGPECSECGESTSAPLCVHHRRYYPDREPWDYPDSDLLLLCLTCHNRIHKLENRVRNLVRSLEPHECYEFNALIDDLEHAQWRGLIKVALARAKNAARAVAYQTDPKGIRHISELVDNAITRYGLDKGPKDDPQ